MKVVNNNLHIYPGSNFGLSQIYGIVHVVNSSSVNSFKNNLDRFWSNQEMYYNFRHDITGTGNRSVSQN